MGRRGNNGESERLGKRIRGEKEKKDKHKKERIGRKTWGMEKVQEIGRTYDQKRKNETN